MQSISEEINSTSSSLITREKIQNTPFTLIGILDQGYRIIMGDYLMVDTCQTKNEALEKINAIVDDEGNIRSYTEWDIILRIAVAVVTRTIMEAATEKKC